MPETPARKAYMGKAEKVLREYAGRHPLLAVWRCEAPEPRNLGTKVDTILVGMPDERDPTTPTELIIVRTYLYPLGDAAQIVFDNGADSLSTFVPFGGGHSPIKKLTAIAKKLPDL